MTHSLFRIAPLLASALLLAAACGDVADAPGETEGATARVEAPSYRYHREFIFVAERGEALLIVPVAFRSTDLGTELDRGVRAWLARGGTWDRFVDETGRTSKVGGVWRVVPIGDLRITVGGPAELESLRFQRGERRLRVELDAPLTSWSQGGDTRFRLLSGRVSIGPEAVTGSILEILRVEPTLEDGWPPSQDFDAVFLTSGDSLQVLVADRVGGESEGEGYAWVRTRSGERDWGHGEIRWLEMRPYQEARRDIPRRWSVRIPAAGIEGELESVGFDAVLGPERGGRRAVEVRYSVTGWLEIQGEVRTVAGMIRHSQQ
jgi:hypothetical protein